MKATGTLLSALLLSPMLALAQSGATQAQPAAAGMPPLAQPQSENGIRYLCGGVGETEREHMRRAAGEYDLSLTFAAQQGGAYLADVGVSIADSRGQPLLQINCDGPMLLVDLPRSGTYRLQAEAGGHTLSKTLRVRDKGRTAAVFAWPRDAVDEGMAGPERSAGLRAPRGR